MANMAQGTESAAVSQDAQGRGNSPVEAQSKDVVDALVRYQLVSRQHDSDNPASFWVAWPAGGYRLDPLRGTGVGMFAFRGERPGARSYGITLKASAAPCVKLPTAPRMAFALDGVRMSFEGRCVGDLLVYLPVGAAGKALLERRMEKGGQMEVRSRDLTATFDLSGLPVLKTMFEAEDAAAASSEHAHVNAVIDAIDNYQREVRDHKEIARVAHWRAWSGRGYGLDPSSGSGLMLVALWEGRAGDVSYAIVATEAKVPCSSRLPVSHREFLLDGVKMSLNGSCVGGQWEYRPMPGPDANWLTRRLGQGGELIVRGAKTRVTFDLAGVPILKSILKAEAAASH